MEFIESRPVLYGRELRDEVHQHCGVALDKREMMKLRKSLYFSRCRLGRPMRQACPQRQAEYKQRWLLENIEDHMCIWMDETHKSNRDFYRKYGWFRPGCQRFYDVNIRTPQAWSTLAALTTDGLIAWKTTRLDKSTGPAGQDTDAFLKDFCQVVLPFIQPWCVRSAASCGAAISPRCRVAGRLRGAS